MTTEEKTTESKPKDPMYGKVWTVSSRHTSFTEAEQAREKLATEVTLAKVRRMSNDTFVVKTRATTLTTTPRKSKAKEKSTTKPEKKKRIGKMRQR
jgi:hypothetical protein